jgi:hypothetical protein
MDKEIRIDGLTEYQRDMLDHMWSLDSMEEYTQWYDLLDEEDQEQADLLQRMVLLASIDQMIPDRSRHYPEAMNVLQKFML